MLVELQEHGCYRLNEVMERESRVESPYSLNKVLGLVPFVEIIQA
jgi:hypothetical protein